MPALAMAQDPGQSGAARPDSAAAAGQAPSDLPPGQVEVTPDSAAPPPPSAPPKVTVSAANGVSIKIEGLVQVQGSTTTIDSVTDFGDELRRMRLVADGDAGGGFSGRLQMDFESARARIRDAYASWKATNALTLRIGQFKPPFNILETTSAKQLLVIERGNRIRGLGTRTTSNTLADAHYSARNRGLMAILALPGRVTLSGGGFLGAGENNEDNDGKLAVGRLEWSAFKLPSKDSKPLILGVGVATNGFFGTPRDTIKVISGDSLLVEDPIYGTALEGSVEYGAYGLPGLHVAGNVVTGDNPFALLNEGGEVELATFFGLQGWGEFLVETGKRIVTGVAPAFRVDRFDPNTDAEDLGNVFLTPGLNLYFGKNVKLQLNYDVIVPDDDALDTESAFRMQTALLF